MPNWASVQAARPLAADGLRPMPSGSVTFASLVWELSLGVAGIAGTMWGP